MTEEQNTNNIASDLNVRFDGALTSTPIQKEEVSQVKSNIIRISPNRSILEAKKIGSRRISPKSNTVSPKNKTLNRGTKRKKVNTSKSSPDRNILTEDETILLDIPKKRLSFSTETQDPDTFHQANPAENLIKLKGLNPTVQSLPVPDVNVDKKKSPAYKKIKTRSTSEPTTKQSTSEPTTKQSTISIHASQIVTNAGERVTIKTANITKNIQNTTITIDESQLAKGLQDEEMAPTNQETIDQIKEDDDQPPTKSDMKSILSDFSKELLTKIADVQKESARHDAKLDVVNDQVKISSDAIKASNDRLEQHIKLTNKQSEEFQRSLRYLQDNHEDLAQNQKYLTADVKDLRYKLDNVISYIENDKRQKEKVTERYYINLLLNEIQNSEKKFKIKGYPYDRHEGWEVVENNSRDILFQLQQRADTQEHYVDLSNIVLRKKNQYVLEFEILGDNPKEIKEIRGQLVGLNRFVDRNASNGLKNIQIQEEIPEPYKGRYFELLNIGRDWKKRGSDRQYRIQFDGHNLVMNVRYSKDTAYTLYPSIKPWAPQRADYNDATGQWTKPEREKTVPPQVIENLQLQELRTVQIDASNEDEKRDIKSYVDMYCPNTESIDLGITGMVLIRYKNQADAENFASANSNKVKINDKLYNVSRCGVYNLITDNKSLQQGSNNFEPETPPKTTVK